MALNVTRGPALATSPTTVVRRIRRHWMLLMCVLAFAAAAIGSAQAGYIYFPYFQNGSLSQYSYADSWSVSSFGNQSIHVAPRNSRISEFYTSGGAGIWSYDSTGSPSEHEDYSAYSGVTERCKNLDATATYYSYCNYVQD